MRYFTKHYNELILSVLFILTFGLASSAAEDDPLTKAKVVFKPIPADAPAIENNEATPEKIRLGKMLYFDPRLSASNLISCNTCHNVGAGGADLQVTSIGHAWQKGPRNAPTVLNSVYNAAQFWDGRAKDLAEQAKGPVQAGVEMSNTPESVVETLKSMPLYVELFEKSFPGDKEKVSFDNMAKAIEVFEATLVTPDSSFDKYLAGDTAALNDKEKQGLKLFMDKGCTACHNGINIGGNGFFKFGLVNKPSDDTLPPADKGRFVVTNNVRDEHVFRAPTLRNVELTAPYFHSGTVWKLKDAVSIMANAQLGIQLSEKGIDSMTAFLKTLTGTQPKVEYPILPPSTDKTPKPSLQIVGAENSKH